MLKASFARALFLVLFSAFCSLLLASEPSFSKSYTFNLAKDEWGVVRIVDLSNKREEEFSFSPTLYDFTNLIINSFYRLYPKQIVLSLRQGGRTYIQLLRPATRYLPDDEVKLLLSFNSFKNGLVEIFVGILDPAGRVDVSFIEAKR